MTGQAERVAEIGRVAPADYMQAMGLHVSSVCVITTSVGRERYGLTATAVSSVCATPPRLLVCVNTSSFAHAKIVEAGHFCVNVLAEDQDVVAKAFAGMLGAVDRFAVADWRELTTGSPVLTGAAAAFDCTIGGRIDQFTHTLFLGDVVGVASRTGQDALVYGARRFRQLRKVFASPDTSSVDMLHF